MIVDSIEYAGRYAGLLPALEAAVRCAREHPGAAKAEFSGGYLMYQQGETKPADPDAFESHRKYLDVQWLLKGREIILWNRLESMKELLPYDSAKDKLSLSGEGSVLEMKPGMMCILWPEDAHSACRRLAGEPAEHYEKIVIKLEI